MQKLDGELEFFSFKSAGVYWNSPAILFQFANKMSLFGTLTKSMETHKKLVTRMIGTHCSLLRIFTSISGSRTCFCFTSNKTDFG